MRSETPAPAVPRPGSAFFLAGDSYPDDDYVEAELRQRLAPRFSGWCGQAEILSRSGHAKLRKAVADRLADLEQAITLVAPNAPVVLFGRSSGARIATLFAARRPVGAVICLAYPFQNPELGQEPSRYAHLERLDVPTLIVQGRSDPYSGPQGAGSFPVSQRVRLLLVDGDHGLYLSAGTWDLVCRSITAFCDRAVG